MRRRVRVWDKHEIKAEVQRKGATLTGIAKQAGLESSACRVALCRRNFSGELALAAFLGVDPGVLWPDRYKATSEHEFTPRPLRSASPNASLPADIGEAA